MVRAIIAAMAEVYLALGSNVGDGQTAFDEAIRLLSHELTAIEQAPRYISKAVGYTEQSDFLNTVIKALTKLSPLDLLTFVKQVEVQVGRIERFRWGPREIDIDIILYDQLTVDEPSLSIPHPRFRGRDFVLRPLLDLDASLVDPVSQRLISTIYDNLTPVEHSIRQASEQ